MQFEPSRYFGLSASSVLVIALSVGPLAAGFAGEQGLQVSRFTIDGGGGMHASGGVYVLSGTIGQPDAGRSAGNEYGLYGGFWFPVVPGDYGEDGSVGPGDYAAFYGCSTGPGGGILGEGCDGFDVDQSGAIDLADFAIIQTNYTGS